MKNNGINWEELSKIAWECRKNAYVLGPTKVGCAVLSINRKIYTGCNIEQIYRSHDIHAEVNAISNMVSEGEEKLIALLVAAERDRFTPCGACMDWIYQFGGKDCLVAYQSKKNCKITIHKASELMPFYPK